MKDDYERIAPIYDLFVEPFLGAVREEVLSAALSHGLFDILDLCCGTGRQAVLLRERGIRTVGVDVSPSMLGKAKRGSPPDIAYYLHDASELPFGDHVFDAALLSLALHEKAPDIRNAILAEAKRVVKPNGKMLVVDYLLAAGGAPATAVALHLIRVVERFAGALHYANFRQFMATGAAEGLLRRCGLRPVFEKRFYFGTIGLFLCEIPAERPGGC